VIGTTGFAPGDRRDPCGREGDHDRDGAQHERRRERELALVPRPQTQGPDFDIEVFGAPQAQVDAPSAPAQAGRESPPRRRGDSAGRVFAAMARRASAGRHDPGFRLRAPATSRHHTVYFAGAGSASGSPTARRAAPPTPGRVRAKIPRRQAARPLPPWPTSSAWNDVLPLSRGRAR
jgi:hypothetical protein